MKSKIHANAKRNYFYPNCGCESKVDCETCPHCGMCTTRVEHCTCSGRLLGLDESLQYDPHRETLGG